MHEPLKGRINRLRSIGALYALWMSLEKESGYFLCNSQYTWLCLGWHVREMEWEGQNSLQNQREILSWRGRQGWQKRAASGSCCRLKNQPKVRTGTNKGSKWRGMEHIGSKEAEGRMLVFSLYFKTIGKINTFALNAGNICILVIIFDKSIK